MNEITTIRVHRETMERLKSLGLKGQSYENIIKLLLDSYAKHKGVFGRVFNRK